MFLKFSVVLFYVMELINPSGRERTTLFDSFWFMYGSLVGEGTEVVPRTISSRLLSGCWWFFALILISSYTANLAAFLTVTKINTPINSLQDLVNQNKIKFGTVSNSRCHAFFQHSKMEIFQRAWEAIDLNKGLVPDSQAGVDRVRAGNYAFVWDTPVNRYMKMQHCDVMTVGEPFDQKGYGIGVPLGVSYREHLTVEILELNEDGDLQSLEAK